MYQQSILGSRCTVDHLSVTKQTYPPQAMQQEPFVGFKVLVRDANAQAPGTAQSDARDKWIDQYIGQILRGTGCFIRETETMSDGYWVVSFPVPRSQAMRAFSSLMRVLQLLEQNFGISRMINRGVVEINVSGYMPRGMELQALNSLNIPVRYQHIHIPNAMSAYRYGVMDRVTDDYSLFRSQWNLSVPTEQLHDEVMILTQLISTIYK
jgi:hypothetical protein